MWHRASSGKGGRQYPGHARGQKHGLGNQGMEVRVEGREVAEGLLTWAVDAANWWLRVPAHARKTPAAFLP